MDPLTVGILSSLIASLIMFFIQRKVFPDKQKVEHHTNNNYYSQTNNTGASNAIEQARLSGLMKLLLAICLPPLAVYLEKGVHQSLWINILLTLLWWPGVIHALLVIYAKPNQS